MRIHLVAIGGSVMHNLALDLAVSGHHVSGSDDEFYEPSRSRLESAGLLPSEPGWFPDKIDDTLDCVIAGMHARSDNPEIKNALDLGIKVYSFPEFFGERCKDKLRIVVAGSHGKTTTTSMIMHVLKSAEKDFDYLVGAALDGFERNVKLSDAPICVIEGDEYPSSPLDRRPKIAHYDPDIVIITGIAWDHMNVFPTWEIYMQVFRDFISNLKAGCKLIWFQGDEILVQIVEECAGHVDVIPYGADLNALGELSNLKIFGSHNFQNMSAAMLACEQVSISQSTFLDAMQNFTGAALRLQLMYEREGLTVYRDFAHAPSKVRATVHAVRERYPEAFLVACFELHTYSSLNAEFLPQYGGSMDLADHAMIFYSPKTLEIKKMPPISPSQITDAFAHHSLEVATSRKMFEERLQFFSNTKENTVVLLMSSGRFENADLLSIVNQQTT